MIVRTFTGVLCVCFSLAATASAGGPPFIRPLTGFEPFEGLADGDEVIWQEPSFSGSTQGINTESDPVEGPWNNSQVVSWAGLPSSAYEIQMLWEDPANTSGLAGVRATTQQVDNLERPSVHLGGKIRFKMAVTAFLWNNEGENNTYGNQITDGSASILMCLGIRETGNDIAQGESDTGSGDLEYVYYPGSQEIPDPNPGSNGIIEWPPKGLRIAATSQEWPPTTLQQYEFNLPTLTVRGFANNGDGVDTAGDGVLDATGNPSGDGVNRGVLESIIFTNDSMDTTGQIFAIYIDDVEFESQVPDPVDPPSVQAPVFSGASVEVLVSTRDDASSAELFVNDVSADTSPAVAGVATFSGLTLDAGDLLTATQTANGVTSDVSLPVVVFAPGTLVADNFDSYASQADLNNFWTDSIANPDPVNAKLLLETDSAASCPNLLREDNPAGADAARLYRSFGSGSGTDGEPLWATWYFKHDSNSGNARTRFELGRFADGDWSSGARADGTCGFGFTNEIAGDLQSEYGLMIKSSDPQLITTNGAGDLVGTNGFSYSATGNGLLWAPTGVSRVANVWQKFQVEIRTKSINYWIDDVKVNPPEWPEGVPRPENVPYQFMILGQGNSNNGPAMSWDNVSVTTGTTALPFGDPNPVSAPAIVAPLFPGSTSVSLENVNSNATQVAIYVDGGDTPVGTAAGPFPSNTATVTVPALSNGDSVTATQTVDVTRAPMESCFSAPFVVSVPVVTLESELVPTQTVVEVSDLEENVASTVNVYRDLGGGTKELIGAISSPTTDPVSVPVTPLTDGETIVATQTIGGAESPDSAGVVVGVPAPAILSAPSVEDTSVLVSEVHPLASEVNVYVDDLPAGSANPSGASSVSVTVPALFVNEVVTATQTIGGIESGLSNPVLVSFPICLEILSERFSISNPSAWNLHGTADTSANFSFDYSSAGIPVSPNGDGSRLGLRMTANTEAPGTVDAITVSPKDVPALLAAQGYRIEFDMWINTTYPQSATGSTHFISAGIGYDNVAINQAVGNGLTDASSGDGAWFAISSDADASQDIRAFLDTLVQGPATGQFAAGTDATANNTNFNDFYIDLFGTPVVPQEQIDLFPGQGNRPMLTGAPGMAWHRVTVTAIGDRARWDVNGVTIANLDANNGPISLDGNVSFGFMDVFTSIPPNDPELGFGLIDNLRVVIGHTPGTSGDWDGDGNVDKKDWAAMADCMGGPGMLADPVSGASCVSVCQEVFDFDLDGDVDLRDTAQFMTVFGP